MPVAFEPLAHLQKTLLKKDLKLSLEPNKTNRTIKAKINVTLNKYNCSGSSAFKSQMPSKISLTKNYCITISVRKNSSIHQIILTMHLI